MLDNEIQRYIITQHHYRIKIDKMDLLRIVGVVIRRSFWRERF